MKLFTPEDAIKLICNRLNTSGLMQISRSDGSRYFGRKNSAYKVRVSDHTDPFQNSDVIYNIVVDSPTISPDIDYLVKMAIRAMDTAKTRARK